MFRLPKLYKLVRLLKLIKLVRVFRIWTSNKFPHFTKIYNRNVTPLTQLLIRMFNIVIFLNHLMACLWYLNAKMGDFSDDCWVKRQGFIDESHSKIYLVSFYWSFQTMSTVGYGDVSSGNFSERLMSCLWMIVGIGY